MRCSRSFGPRLVQSSSTTTAGRRGVSGQLERSTTRLPTLVVSMRFAPPHPAAIHCSARPSCPRRPVHQPLMYTKFRLATRSGASRPGVRHTQGKYCRIASVLHCVARIASDPAQSAPRPARVLDQSAVIRFGPRPARLHWRREPGSTILLAWRSPAPNRTAGRSSSSPSRSSCSSCGSTSSPRTTSSPSTVRRPLKDRR